MKTIETLAGRVAASILLALCMGLPLSAGAQTQVTFTTPVGDFTIQLLDELTPITASNFINYVANGRYDGTIVHRTVPGFVIQGGWLSFNEQANTLNPIAIDNAILNEPLISNARGTVAMAKVGNNVNSATSQWFINLSDNTSLDQSNGGFTVFGFVTGDGMTVVDQIANLPARPAISGVDFDVPLLNDSGGSLTAANFVRIEASITQPYFPNTYNEERDRLNFKVDAGELGRLGLSFVIESQFPQVVIRALPETVIPLTHSPTSFGTFDTVTEELLIPELAIGGSIAYRNVRLRLSNPEQLLFTLISAE